MNIDKITSFEQGKSCHWLTHWGRMTHIRVSILNVISSHNGVSPGRHRAIICTNAGIVLIEPFGNKLKWNHNRNWYTFFRHQCVNYEVLAVMVLTRYCPMVFTFKKGNNMTVDDLMGQRPYRQCTDLVHQEYFSAEKRFHNWCLFRASRNIGTHW